MTDTTYAAAIIALAVGILLGAVPVYAAWNRDSDRLRRQRDHAWADLRSRPNVATVHELRRGGGR